MIASQHVRVLAVHKYMDRVCVCVVAALPAAEPHIAEV